MSTESGPGINGATARAQALASLRIDKAVGVKQPPVVYVGLATRTLSFLIDAVVINAASIAVWLATGLALTLFELPSQIEAAVYAILAAAYVVWAIAYFVSFWSSTGQTPGDRVMQLRVVDGTSGEPIPLRRSFVRLVGMALGALPLFLGYITGLFDDRCRCFHDRLARTVVIDAPVYSKSDLRRMAIAEISEDDDGSAAGNTSPAATSAVV